MERGQFTFYRSYYEAIKTLSKKDRDDVIMAICAYALDEVEPTTLSGIQSAVFTLIRPTLDTSRRKAISGKNGGSKPKANGKQSGSKSKAKAKQTEANRKRGENASEGEIEKENEMENEIENECYTPTPFAVFWKAYPKKVGKEAARKAFAKVHVPIDALITAIEAQKRSPQWTKDNGQYIPYPAKWLNQGYWENEPLTPKESQGFVYDYGDCEGSL